MAQRPYLAGAIIGAAVGGAFGYLFFTDEGHQRRQELTRVAERLMNDFQELRTLWDRIHAMAEQYQHAGRDAFGPHDYHVGSSGGVS
jgi:gas vesicle protein